ASALSPELRGRRSYVSTAASASEPPARPSDHAQLLLFSPRRRREVSTERHDHAGEGPEGPLAAEPVLHARVPQQRRRQEDEPEQHHQRGAEQTGEPVAEQPE